jgi:hypothetical protein
MRNWFLYSGLIVFILFTSCQASKKPPLSHQDSSYGQAPDSRNRGASSSGATAPTSKKTANKKSFARTEAQAREEFEERMKQNAKKYEEQAKMAEKPQYSDPSYFGHKKKPKKRPVGKRKLCKECGIVH